MKTNVGFWSYLGRRTCGKSEDRNLGNCALLVTTSSSIRSPQLWTVLVMPMFLTHAQARLAIMAPHPSPRFPFCLHRPRHWISVGGNEKMIELQILQLPL